jgi:hypothetical protein
MSTTLNDITEEKKILFKKDLKNLSNIEIVRKYITYGDTYVLDHDKYYLLKQKISNHFDIHPSEVIIVGSGKLGFSIAENVQSDPPKYRYRNFGNDSDIDVAIISQGLFEKIWLEIYNYYIEKGMWNRQDRFEQYFFRGWLRPDMFPTSKNFPICEEWWRFFQELTSSNEFGFYKISAGLYKSWFFLEKYQSGSIEQCKLNLI